MMHRIIADKKAAGVRTASEERNLRTRDLLSVLLAMVLDDARHFTGGEEDMITENCRQGTYILTR